MLAAIPSVVYGFWGLFVLAPLVQSVFTWLGGPNIGGQGILSAGMVLSIMIVPYIAAISYDVCQAVPRSQREGSLALGATRWQTIWRVVLPYARPGIVAGGFLALGRALGETMAVTMLIGNRDEISLSLFAVGDYASPAARQPVHGGGQGPVPLRAGRTGLALAGGHRDHQRAGPLLLNRVGSNKSLLPFRMPARPPSSRRPATSRRPPGAAALHGSWLRPAAVGTAGPAAGAAVRRGRDDLMTGCCGAASCSR